MLGHLEGSESTITHSVKEGKLDPPMTLMFTLVSAIIFATIHLLNHQAEQWEGQVFLMSLRWLVYLVIPFDTKMNRSSSRKLPSNQIPNTCCPFQLDCWTPPESHICNVWNIQRIADQNFCFTWYATMWLGLFSLKEKLNL